MFSTAMAQTNKVQRDEKGTVAVLFGVVGLVVIGFSAMALDIGRATHSNSRLSYAMDTAALAAVKAARLEGLSKADAEALATRVFNENMAISKGSWAMPHWRLGWPSACWNWGST